MATAIEFYTDKFGQEKVAAVMAVIESFREANQGEIPALYKVFIAHPRDRKAFYGSQTVSGDSHSVEMTQENREAGILFNVLTSGWPSMMSVWGIIPNDISALLPNTEVGGPKYWDERTAELRC